MLKNYEISMKNLPFYGIIKKMKQGLYSCVANMVKELSPKEYPIPEDLTHYLEEEGRNHPQKWSGYLNR